MDSESKNRIWSKVAARVARTQMGNLDEGSFEASVPPLAHSFADQFGRAEAAISAEALLENYDAIQDLVPSHAILPMVKADAYGHGAEFVSRTLAGASNLYGFGVASLEEGREVRDALGARRRGTRIVVFSGTANWSEDKGHYCERYGLTPAIVAEDDWKKFLKGKWPERLKYHLKFNTGMNRLGMAPGFASQILSQLRDKPGEWRPEGVATHMAVAEEPDHALTIRQIEAFRSITSSVRSTWTDTLFHLANSSSIWNAKKFGLEGWTDIVRPGLSLYGVPPWAGAPIRGIRPVMEIRFAVIQRRVLKPGESIGYGATYRRKGNEPPLEVAILGAGYADGLHRMNSGTSRVLIGGRVRPLLGIVSMDMSAAECDASVKAGDWAVFFGNGIDPWTQAKAAGTIPYEILTSLSRRVRRIYE